MAEPKLIAETVFYVLNDIHDKAIKNQKDHESQIGNVHITENKTEEE